MKTIKRGASAYKPVLRVVLFRLLHAAKPIW